MNRREFVSGSLAAGAATLGLGALAIEEALPLPAVATNTCTVRYVGMKVLRLSEVAIHGGAHARATDVVMRDDHGFELAYSTTNDEHIEELQLAAVNGATFTFEVTQQLEVPAHGET